MCVCVGGGGVAGICFLLVFICLLGLFGVCLFVVVFVLF